MTKHEIWTELYLYGNISKKVSTFALLNCLFQKGMGNYDNFIEPGLKYSISRSFYLEGYFRHERYQDEGRWYIENRPQIRLGSQFKLGKWAIRNRQRFEYRLLPELVKKFRFRTDLRLIPPESIKLGPFRPFYTGEIFVSKGQLGRTRNYLGIYMDGERRIVPWIYVLHQGDHKSLGWQSTYIIGGLLALTLN
ncbi:DUF2490 domain-containing protein [Echinicola shivajiensis]|uniref:DUF2490 domain-containing protein n=1 Tax=Echinicola shivajiensis TaxID=1035916 RepID=UPI001BFC25BD|nr:DUF2490 domain-containing protein [Echinicola shivajiensis]